MVEKDNYLLELSRYIVLNPVRAKMVATARDWLWSSYLATAGEILSPPWLSTDWILSIFGQTLFDAQQKYQQFVGEGMKRVSPWSELKNQIYLGSKIFVNEMQNKLLLPKDLSETPKPQHRLIAYSLPEFEKQSTSRNQCIKNAYHSGTFTMKEIGIYFDIHYSRVSRIVNSV